MKSITLSLLATSLLLCSVGCGAIFIGGAIHTGTTIHGSVTSVVVSSVADGTGETTQVTFITFLQGGASTTIGFCNDQTAQFPLNQAVSVNFNPGQVCAVVAFVIQL